MHRIDNNTAATAIPAQKPPGPGGFFTAGSPQIGAPATIVEADWLNTVQEEIIAVIDDAGIALDKAVHTQLRDAIARGSRRRLTANLTVFVNANNGDDVTANGSPTLPFRTLARAREYVVAYLDLAGRYRVTFNCTGNFPDGLAASGGLVGQLSGLSEEWFFNTGSVVPTLTAQDGARFMVTGSPTLTGGYCGIGCNQGGTIFLNSAGITFGSSYGGGDIYVNYSGLVLILAGFNKTASYGPSQALFNCGQIGQVAATLGTPGIINMIGNPVFSTACCYCQQGGQVNLPAQRSAFRARRPGHAMC